MAQQSFTDYSKTKKTNVDTIKKELKANYKFIKHDGLILETFANNLLKLCNSDVNKTIEYLETLSKKDITDKFICIVKDFETSFEISEIIKSSIKVETDKLKVVQAKVNVLGKETDDLLEYKEELEADLAKLKTEQEKITDDFKQKCEDSEKRLEITKDTLQNTIDGVYRNELYEDEFNIPECNYILKEPVIHLDIAKIKTNSINNLLYDNLTLGEVYLEYNHEKDKLHSYGINQGCYPPIKNIDLNFPVNIMLNDNEFIVKVYIINDADHNKYYHTNQKTNKLESRIIARNTGIKRNIIYLTNYGRFIKSDGITINYKPVGINTQFNSTNLYVKLEPSKKTGFDEKYYRSLQSYGFLSILDGHLYTHSSAPVQDNNQSSMFGDKTISVFYRAKVEKPPMLVLPNLMYRMPKIFIDVIDAFQTQNNDLMQECCKRYLDITRETERKKEILTTLQFNTKPIIKVCELNQNIHENIDIDNLINEDLDLNENPLHKINEVIIEKNTLIKQDDIIKEKDAIIDKKENIIKEHSVIIDYQNKELEKLKNENAKLKKALQSFLNE